MALAWCDETRIEGKVPAGCAVEFTLDLFHIMKYLVRAFPKKDSNITHRHEHLHIGGGY